MRNFSLSLATAVALIPLGMARADSSPPPYAFSDAFFLANGLDPATVIGRPMGAAPNSIIDVAPDANHTNVRLLQNTAAWTENGEPTFFTVTGLPRLASFLTQDALDTAEEFQVYECPRATNPQFAVFPKRQDLIVDTRNGYFSNDPLGTWRINLVRYTPAAFDTPAGQAALAALAAQNGVDLDGTPMIRRVGEINALEADGFVIVETPPMDGSGGFRWFFCPIPKDPRGGFIRSDAFLEVVSGPDGEPLAAEMEIVDAFNCLQQTGDFCENGGPGRPGDLNADGRVDLSDLGQMLSSFGLCRGMVGFNNQSDIDQNDCVELSDLGVLLSAFGS